MPIFDQGYQHWQGPLTGHAWRWLAIARHGVRVQTQNRILRVLILLAWMPALALVVFVAIWGMVEQRNETVLPLAQMILPAEILRDPIAFRVTVWTLAYWYFFKTQMFCIMLLVVIAGPGLISRDLRFNALPLYLARPLTRFDYFIGKLGVIGALVAAVAIVPAVFAYIIGVGFSFDLSVVKDTYPLLLGSVAYGLIITLSTGTLMLAMSSMTRKSLYVGIAWAVFWLVSTSVASIMVEIRQQSGREINVDEDLKIWLAKNPPPPGVQMRGTHLVHFNNGPGKGMPDHFDADKEQEVAIWLRAWNEANQKAWMQAQLRELEASRNDWRPIISYVGNLSRMADLLLDTDTAWVAVGKALVPRQGPSRRGGPGPPPELEASMDRRLADQFVAQYPWWWSATVLLGLVGISTWILTRRIKSLDRLK